MQYITREIERKFGQMNSFFKAVLVTGARQVGKTTMLKHLSEGTSRTYVSLDDIMARELAQSDPVLFFQTYKPPILIDEVQHAPPSGSLGRANDVEYLQSPLSARGRTRR